MRHVGVVIHHKASFHTRSEILTTPVKIVNEDICLQNEYIKTPNTKMS